MTRAADWTNTFGKLPHGRGVGLACSSYLSGAGLPIYWNDMPHSGVQLKLDRSGGVTAFCGATEIGQGSDDVLVGVRGGGARHRADRHPRGHRRHGSDAGRSRLVFEPRHADDGQRGDPGGRARARSARRRRVAKLAVPKDRLVFADRRVFDTENPATGVSFTEAVCLAEAMFGTIGTTGSYTPPRSAARFKGGGVGPSPTYSYSAAIVEVEVDPSTGWIHVPRVWIAHDIGRSLNPTLVRGQVEGSVYMALGEALMEEQIFRRLPPKLSHALVHKFPSMLEYKSPTTLDMPEVFTELVENPDPRGPFGAKEVGQGPLLPVMPAVANAVYDAVGVRIDEVPITPEKILKALDAKAAGKAPRYGPDALPGHPVARAARGAAAVGRRRRTARRAQAKREISNAATKAERGPKARCAMMRLPRFRYHAPRTVREAAELLAGSPGGAMLVAGGTDLLPNMKRRQQVPAHARSACARRGAARSASHQRPGRGLTIGAGVTLTELVRDGRIRQGYRRALAGGRAGRDAASAQHGHARRQPLPRHALQLLRPELRVAQGDRLLHEEGRRDLLGRDVEPEVPRGLVHRHRARRCWRSARASRSCRPTRRVRSPRRISTRTTASTT